MSFSQSVAVVLPSTLALFLLLPTNFDWMKYALIFSSSSSIPDDDGHNVVCSTEEDDDGDLLVGGNVPSCMVVEEEEEGAMVNIFVTGGPEKELECTVGAGVVVVVVGTLLAMVGR